MPRGRHRHSPPLHRLLPPSAIAGVSLVCAVGPWMFTAPVVLRSLAAAAAVTAVAGAVVLRRWDTQAGRKVADLTRARASDEWRFEERVAELESDLEESRELRARLDQKLRAKRSELARLRNEHAALLRRYATAETERASALEGRRLLELEAGADLPALPAAPSRAASAQGGSAEAGSAGTGSAQGGSADAGPVGAGPVRDGSAEAGSAEEVPAAVAPAVFSPEGSELFARAVAALARFGAEGGRTEHAAAKTEAAAGAARTTASAEAAGHEAAPAREDDPQGKSEAGGSAGAVPGGPVRQPAGHYAVPTAVAVVPPAPARRPVTEGGFDFFGAKKGAPPAALEAVQNEDLADVVGPEALALHKAEAEAGAGAEAGAETADKPAGEDTEAPAAGQVIDLTAHDETEQIDLQGLRTAVS
ncbi:coiled-coil domain-containing protein [Streptomyces sp. NRRL S-340]|uniref:coiled-coil domain-containing protein n=1 Tax=Streptomyces sp. NRRL S-340 TaxID=1463901 RepID=UPI00068B5C37|nr:hypothetical protein [Streptomyces sp. NRRL S-340]